MLSPTVPPVLDPVCHHRTGQRFVRQLDAVSGLFERVDSTRLRLIHQLFPASTIDRWGASSSWRGCWLWLSHISS
jgi:hypothetical protein